MSPHSCAREIRSFGSSARKSSRVERYLIEAAIAAGYVPRTWDVAQGVTDIAGKAQPMGGVDHGETLNAIRERVI